MRSEKKFVISVSVINITGCVNVRLEDNIKTDLKEIEWGGGSKLGEFGWRSKGANRSFENSKDLMGCIKFGEFLSS